jgi:hypothetical protein
MTPASERGRAGDAIAVAQTPIVLVTLRTGVAHPARADGGAGIAEHPVTLRVRQPWWPSNGRTWGQIAADMIRRVMRVDGKFAAGRDGPKVERGHRRGTRQGLRGQGPCPLPPDEDGQGPRCLHGVPRLVLSGDHGSECSSGLSLAPCQSSDHVGCRLVLDRRTVVREHDPLQLCGGHRLR